MPVRKTSREEILVKALQVFRQKGYHATSLKDLSMACGVEKAHFYYYFEGGKEQIMAEVLESVLLYFQERVIPIAYDQSLLPPERLDNMLGKLGRMLGSGTGGCIMGNTTLECAALADPPVFLDIARAYFEMLQQALQDLLQNEYPPETAHQYAEQMIQEIEGSLLLMQLYQDPQYLERALQRAAQRMPNP